ncbi:MAG: hypothetical protein HY791_24315 [Deltaproteobacteria bacterium]|nr:hypothetical protein [Deltaproteobacteria bacterium]
MLSSNPQSFGFRRARAKRATRDAIVWAMGAVSAVLTLPVVFGRFYYGVDLSRYDLGALCAIRNQLGRGESLLVSRELGNGLPLLFDPSLQMLYPVRWLVLLFPADLGASLSVILHLVIAAGSTAYLGRTFGLRAASAAAAGVVFAISGTCLDLATHSVYLVGASWVPLSWALARRARRGAHTLPLGLAIAAPFLGGEAQAAGTGAAIALFELGRALFREPSRRRHALGPALAVFGGVALGVAAWLPALGELSLARRAQMELREQLSWSFSRELWLGALWPGLFVWPSDGATYLESIWVAPNTAFWNAQPFVGPLGISVAVAGALRRQVRAAAWVGMSALAFSLGREMPVLSTAMVVFPPLALFRYPEKYFLVAMLGSAIIGLGAIDEARRPAGRRRLLVAVGATLIGQLLLTAVVSYERTDLTTLSRATGAQVLPGLPARPGGAPLGELVWWSALAASVPISIAASLLVTKKRALYVALTGVLGLEQLISFPAHARMGPALASRASGLDPRTLALDAGAPVMCVGSRVLTSRVEPEVDPRWDPIAADRRNLVPFFGACDGFSSGEMYSIFQTRLNFHMLFEDDKPIGAPGAASRAMGCSYFVGTDPPHDGNVAQVPAPELEARGLGLFRVTDPLPQVFVSRNPIGHRTDGETLRSIRRSKSASAVAAIIDDPAGHTLSGRVLPSGTGVAVELEALDSSTIQLRATGAGGAIVGLRTAYLAGWEAWQGEETLPTVRVAGTHLGVWVHDVSRGPVSVSYRPPYLAWVLVSSLISVGMLAGAQWVHQRLPPARRLSQRPSTTVSNL